MNFIRKIHAWWMAEPVLVRETYCFAALVPILLLAVWGACVMLSTHR